MSESNALIQPPNGKQERLFHGGDGSPRDRCWKKAYKCISVARFMGSYYLMLTVCFGTLVYILWEGADSLGNPANEVYSMEVASVVMLGLFSVLATFTVVFFALRAEEGATNSSRSVVQDIVDEAFNGEEEAIVVLLDADQNTNESTPSGNKSDITSNKTSFLVRLFCHNAPEKNSIYFGVARHLPQTFIWFLVLAVMFLSLILAYNFWKAHHLLSAQALVALSIGILGILVALTVVLFALRAAQFSQIAGRIASYSVIERMAAIHEQEYHKLLDAFRAFLIQEKLRTRARQYPPSIDKSLERSERDSFAFLRECEQHILYGFSFFLALCAIFTIGYFTFVMGRFGFTELGVNLIVVLFIFLISFITLFFSGRVLLSAVSSSEIRAAEMTRLELKNQKDLLHDRITAVEGIRMLLANYLGADPQATGVVKMPRKFTFGEILLILEGYSVDLFAIARQGVDEQTRDLAQVQTHLRYLQIAGTGKGSDAGKNRQFIWLRDYLKELWTERFEEMEFLLSLLKDNAPLEKKTKDDVTKQISAARKENKILMKLQLEQIKQQDLMPKQQDWMQGLSAKEEEERNERHLTLFGYESFLELDFDREAKTLIKLWREVKTRPSEFEEQYNSAKVKDVNMDLGELKKCRKIASGVFHFLLLVIWLELVVIRLKKAVSGLPQLQVVEESDEPYKSDWSYVKFLQELKPVFLDTVGPEPILDDDHWSLMEEIKKAPELAEFFPQDRHQGSE